MPGGKLIGGAVALVALTTCMKMPAGEPVAAAPLSVPVVAPAAPAPVAPQQAAPHFTLHGPMTQGGVVRGTAPEGTTFLTFNGDSVPVAADGEFLIAFDRDAAGSATLVARLRDGTEVRDDLTVSPRAWHIERIDRLPPRSQVSDAWRRRRAGEIEQIVAARAMQTGADGWRQDFLWPVTGRISGLFGSQRIYGGEPASYHSGVDIARPTGTTVLAPADGVVILAAETPFSLEGHLLMLDHGMGLNSAFLHLSRIDVKVGEHVRRGQPVGAIGMTGSATGPHLHWSMKWRAARIDPLLIAGPMPAAQ
ncbi:M23 family metallopeptidase [Sphingosinithalassobacter portus]|uniref:M23 family metallopeptidase n=1 Tax=Stakelama portus TaxID=2676234 RepID=UPI001EFE77FC|nr:M23 family metallopeptidase [Sphingosinithalassobacter portus]